MAGYEYGGSVFDTNGRQFGNTGKNANQVFGDVTNPTKQKQRTVNDVREFTMSSYRKLYKDLEGLHTSYLANIKSAEETHYKNLTKADRSGFIYKQYDDLYKKLEQRHNLYLQRIGGKQGNNTNVALWANPNAQQKGTAKAGATASASENTSYDITSGAISNLSDKLDSIAYNAEAGARNSNAIGVFLSKTDKDNRREANDLKNSLSKAIAEGREPTPQEKERDKERKRQSASMKEVNSAVMDIVGTSQRQLIQGKYMNRLVDDVLDVVKVFQKQESVADSVVSLIMIALNSIIGWLGDGISNIYQTQQETYKTFGLYYERAGDANEQNALYHNMMEDKITLLNDNNYRNNLKATEWWKAQAGLLEKGFSTSASYSASLQNTLLNKIAPTLDTNNQYFLDLQQQGLFDITKSLGGIVESVRSTAGSSRVTMGSLSTIIDKLVPVELYTKRELMDDKARAYLSALENSGMATADAINLVNDSIEAYYDPYKGMTSGNVLQRVALAQMGGNPESWVDLIGAQIGLADMFTSGAPDALTQGAVNSYLGASWLNARANYGTINQTFLEELEKALQEEYSPSSAYDDLIKAFRDSDLFTTPEEMLENIASNSTLANDINGFLQDIALDVAFIAEVLADVFDKARIMKGDEDYQNEQLDKAISAGSEAEKEAYINNAVASYAVSKAKGHEWWEYTPIGGQVKGVMDITDGNVGQGIANIVTFGTSEKLGDLGAIWATKKNAQEKVANASNSSLASQGFVYVNGQWISEDSLAQRESGSVSSSGYSDSWYAQNGYVKENGVWVRKYGKGGFVSTPQLAVVGDNPYGEIISPIPQLSSAVMRGVNLANKNSKPDTSDVEAVIIQVGEAIVKAIAENGGTIVFDNSTGLMSGGSKSSLKPIMGGKGGY